MPRRLALVAALLGCSIPGAALAGTDSDTLNVSATVIASCDVTAGALSFGNYDPVSATPLDAATTISVVCTNGAGYEVLMSAGSGSGATVAARKMTAGGNLLTYSLYRDAGHANVWGVTTGGGGDTVTGAGTGATQTLDVYGRVPAQQTAPAGAYTDTVTVTVSY